MSYTVVNTVDVLNNDVVDLLVDVNLLVLKTVTNAVSNTEAVDLDVLNTVT